MPCKMPWKTPRTAIPCGRCNERRALDELSDYHRVTDIGPRWWVDPALTSRISGRQLATGLLLETRQGGRSGYAVLASKIRD
jgi:hypothetical protein